jgi:hypothetical protein
MTTESVSIDELARRMGMSRDDCRSFVIEKHALLVERKYVVLEDDESVPEWVADLLVRAHEGQKQRPFPESDRIPPTGSMDKVGEQESAVDARSVRVAGFSCEVYDRPPTLRLCSTLTERLGELKTLEERAYWAELIAELVAACRSSGLTGRVRVVALEGSVHGHRLVRRDWYVEA